jgi:hypothetical protein
MSTHTHSSSGDDGREAGFPGPLLWLAHIRLPHSPHSACSTIIVWHTVQARSAAGTSSLMGAPVRQPHKVILGGSISSWQWHSLWMRVV